jgi:hypothetical protein
MAPYIESIDSQDDSCFVVCFNLTLFFSGNMSSQIGRVSFVWRFCFYATYFLIVTPSFPKY